MVPAAVAISLNELADAASGDLALLAPEGGVHRLHGVVDGNGVGVVEPAGELHLALEARQRALAHRLGVEHFDRRRSPQEGVPGAVHGPHAAGADLFEGRMIFRLSQKLATKIKEGSVPAVPLDDNPLVDWSAQLFLADRTQYVLLSNTQSLYSTVIYGKGITHDGNFIERALSGIREFMEADGQEFAYHRFIVPATDSVRFAKALNRSVTGSMNDMIRHATYWLTEGELSPFEVGFRLNEIPMSALGNTGSPYGIARKVFKALANDVVA